MHRKFLLGISMMSITLSVHASDPHHGASTSSQEVGQRVDQAKTNQFWWPEQLNLSSLRDHDARANPLGENFDYAQAFNAVDLAAVKADINALLTNSQDWWPADFGNYGPFFIRLAWHSAGTYRTLDGRGGADGGQMRFDPLNSWPDNGNLDKARRLLWPIKQKYGQSLSWADLMILAGTVGMENMGFETFGFAGGRADDWEPDLVYWGPEITMLASERHDKDGKLEKPLGAAHMGLIYVNPEGPQGKPDPVGSAKSVRVTFGRMAMNDEETVALVAGGHTFGKMHGARKKSCVGPEPGAATIEEQGLGWKNSCGKGHSEDTVTSGLEGAWTQAPTQWTTLYLQNLLNFEWQQIRSPAGALQWIPTDESLHSVVPDAHVKGKFNPPVMTTADLALKYDPAYRKIAERFLADPKEYQLAFAKAWFKLTHRDMGPRIRYLGSDVPSEVMIWQDPLPQASSKPVNARQIKQLKRAIGATDLSVADLVGTAWASASSFRGSDMRGGANGACLSLAPQKDWAVNQPQKLARVLNVLKAVQSEFNANSRRGVEVSLADVIVLGGAVGLERAAKEAGTEVSVPFTPGRVDALQEQTDVVSFAVLEPTADAFRNYFNVNQAYRSPAEMMVDKADQLRLTVPEMTVLLGGMRVLNANTDGSAHGVLTERPGTLSNDFFLNLLNGAHPWRKAATEGTYEQVDSATQEVKFTATSVDLIFGSNSELRAIAEAYAFDDAAPRFVKDFVSAWAKVMQLDLFDLENN